LTFLWGTAVAGHQVEGDNTASDWWEYEQKGRLPYKSEKACDFWNRWPADFGLIERLGHNAFRFSTEWARVEPEPGRFDESAIERYVEMVKDLKARGIEPVVTLHHFVNPLWFAEKGGFEKRENLDDFARYAEKMVEALAPHVRWWITINEPMVYGYESYLLGAWPPLKQDLSLTARVIGNLLEAHARAYDHIHRWRPDAQVSIAKHVRIFRPHRPGHPGDHLAAWFQDYASNRAVLGAFRSGRFLGRRIKGLRGSWEYVGLNYYTRQTARFTWDAGQAFGREIPAAELGAEVNDLGWEIYPEGLYRVLLDLGRLGLPVVVTENGICAKDNDDTQRVRYLHSHLDAVKRAMKNGVDVQGYLYWTLMDNFEWAEGYAPRFGLVEVDFKTLERRPRPSAVEFAQLGEKFREAGRVTESARQSRIEPGGGELSRRG